MFYLNSDKVVCNVDLYIHMCKASKTQNHSSLGKYLE